MSENRRQLLKDAMDNKETYRVPMGFWHHFVLGKDQFQGLERPELLDRIVEGHKRYFGFLFAMVLGLITPNFPITLQERCSVLQRACPSLVNSFLSLLASLVFLQLLRFC